MDKLEVQGRYEAGNTWIIKIGSSLLTRDGQGLAQDLVQDWVRQIVDLSRSGIRVVLVSSGAVAEGMSRLGMKQRPQSLQHLQAAAAVGQMGLIQAYESEFQKYGLHTAQILLTHEDLKSRERYINARGTLRNLVELGVIPVVNENDTVVTDEIRFGDNDTLAALVANLMEADTLLLLTDQKGLYSEDPRKSGDATLVNVSDASNPALDTMVGEGSKLGRGGMITKLRASRIAARSGANTIIAAGVEPDVIARLSRGEVTGTLLLADDEPLVARKQWLAALPTRGHLVLDQGAVRVLRDSGKSLLPVGVTQVVGQFRRGDMVACVDQQGKEVARGLANYSCDEATSLCGRASHEIEGILGYVGDAELIHRDNLVVSHSGSE